MYIYEKCIYFLERCLYARESLKYEWVQNIYLNKKQTCFVMMLMSGNLSRGHSISTRLISQNLTFLSRGSLLRHLAFTGDQHLFCHQSSEKIHVKSSDGCFLLLNFVSSAELQSHFSVMVHVK